MIGMNKYQLPNGGYELKPEYAADVADLLATTFLKQNEVWKETNLPIEQLRLFFLKEVDLHLRSQERLRKRYNDPNIIINHVAVINETLVGVAMHLQIEEYRRISTSQKESEVELFRELEKEGKELIKAIDINALEGGKYVYATWGAHAKVPGASPMDKVYEVSLGYDHMRSQGFRGMVFRSSSERLVRMHTTLGAELMREMPFSHNGKNFRIWLLREDFDNPMMNQIIEEAKTRLHQGWRAKL